MVIKQTADFTWISITKSEPGKAVGGLVTNEKQHRHRAFYNNKKISKKEGVFLWLPEKNVLNGGDTG